MRPIRLLSNPVTNKLLNSLVAGQNISGWNIVVEDIMMNDVRNGSLYQCV